MLRHQNRRAILDLLRVRPGMNLSQLARKLDVHRSIADHHIKRLEEEAGLVVTRKVNDHGEVHCFLAEDSSLWRDRRTRILYGFSPGREVALYLAEHSGATTREIGQALGIEEAKVRYHLRTLRRQDLAEQCWFEREVIYTATPRLERWVEEVGEGFPRRWEQEDDEPTDHREPGEAPP